MRAMDKARRDAEQDAARESAPSSGDSGPMKLLGAAFGWVWIGAIGFGIIGAVLSPTSCSSGAGGNYRAR